MEDSAYRLSQVPWDCDFLATSAGRIFRAYAFPPGPEPLNLVVFCNPLGEEAKSSFMTLSHLARALWASGWGLARFDYPGTGDSEGDFSLSRPQDWIQSGISILEDLRARLRVRRLVLLGVRLGGNIAAALASRLGDAGAPAAGAVLWKPAIDMAQTLRHLSRVSRRSGGDGMLDHLGWQYSRPCLAAIKSELGLPPGIFQTPLLLVHLAGGRDCAKEYRALASRLGPPSRFLSISRPAFLGADRRGGCRPAD